MRFQSQYQRGQVLLIVILIMVVTLTVGLSVISHTITTLRTTKESESSQRAFSAAEAGVEKLLNSTNNSLPSTTLSNGSSFSGSVSTISGTFIPVNNFSPVFQDDGADVWLSTYPTYVSPFNGTVKVYWSTGDTECNSAALEILMITGTKANPVITHSLVDACDARRASNHGSTEQTGGAVGGKTFVYSYSIAVTNGLIMRVIPLYTSTVIGVSGIGANLPAQGQNIVSTGTAGGTSRKITVFKGYPRLPMEFFSYVLFSH
jgi:hypothetical protein